MFTSCTHFLVQSVFRIPSVPVGSRGIQFCFRLCVAHEAVLVKIHGAALDVVPALFQAILQTQGFYSLRVVACDEATRVFKEGSL